MFEVVNFQPESFNLGLEKIKSSALSNVSESFSQFAGSFLHTLETGNFSDEQKLQIPLLVEQLNGTLNGVREKLIDPESKDIKSSVSEVVVLNELVKLFNEKLIQITKEKVISNVKPLSTVFTIGNTRQDDLTKMMNFYPLIKTSGIDEDFIETVGNKLKRCIRVVQGLTPSDDSKNELIKLYDSKQTNLLVEEVINKSNPDSKFTLVERIKYLTRIDTQLDALNTILDKTVATNTFVEIVNGLLSEQSIPKKFALNIFYLAVKSITSQDYFNNTTDRNSVMYRIFFTDLVAQTFDKINSHNGFLGNIDLTKQEVENAKNELNRFYRVGIDNNGVIHSLFKDFYDFDETPDTGETKTKRNIFVPDLIEGEYYSITKEGLNFPEWYKANKLNDSVKNFAEGTSVDYDKEIMLQMEKDIRRRNRVPEFLLDKAIAINQESDEVLDIPIEGDSTIENVTEFEIYANKLLSKFEYGQPKQTFEEIAKTIGFFVQFANYESRSIRNLARLNLIVLTKSFYARVKSLGDNSYYELLGEEGRGGDQVSDVDRINRQQYLAKIMSEMADVSMVLKFGKLRFKSKTSDTGFSETNLSEFLSNLTIGSLGGDISGLLDGVENEAEASSTDLSDRYSKRFRSYKVKGPLYNPAVINRIILIPNEAEDVRESKIKRQKDNFRTSVIEKLIFLAAEKDIEKDTNFTEQNAETGITYNLYAELRREATLLTWNTMIAAIGFCGIKTDGNAQGYNKITVIENEDKKEILAPFYKDTYSLIAPFVEKLTLFADAKDIPGIEDLENKHEGENSVVNKAYSRIASLLFYFVLDRSTINHIIDTFFYSDKQSQGKEIELTPINVYEAFLEYMQTSYVNFDTKNNPQIRQFQITEKSQVVDRKNILAELELLYSIVAVKKGFTDKNAYVWLTTPKNATQSYVQTQYTNSEGIITEEASIVQKLHMYLLAIGLVPDTKKSPAKSIIANIVDSVRSGTSDYAWYLVNMPTNPVENNRTPHSWLALLSAYTNPSFGGRFNWKRPAGDKYPSAYLEGSLQRQLKTGQAPTLLTQMYFGNPTTQNGPKYNDYFADKAPLIQTGNSLIQKMHAFFAGLNRLSALRKWWGMFESGKKWRKDGKAASPTLDGMDGVTGDITEVIGKDLTEDDLAANFREYGLEVWVDVIMGPFIYAGSVFKNASNRQFMFPSVMALAETLKHNFKKIFEKYKDDVQKFLDDNLNINDPDTKSSSFVLAECMSLGIDPDMYSYVYKDIKQIGLQDADNLVFPTNEVDSKGYNIESNVFSRFSNEIISRKVMYAFLYFRTLFAVSTKYYETETGLTGGPYLRGDGDATSNTILTTQLESVFKYWTKTIDDKVVLDKMGDLLVNLERLGVKVDIDFANTELAPTIVINNPHLKLNRRLFPNRNYTTKDLLLRHKKGARIDPWNGMKIISFSIKEIAQIDKALRIRKAISYKNFKGIEVDLNKMVLDASSIQEIELKARKDLEIKNLMDQLALAKELLYEDERNVENEIAALRDGVELVWSIIENQNVDLSLIPIKGYDKGEVLSEQSEIPFQNQFANIMIPLDFRIISNKLHDLGVKSKSIQEPGRTPGHEFNEIKAGFFRFTIDLPTKILPLIFASKKDPRMTYNTESDYEYSMLGYLNRLVKSRYVVIINPNNLREAEQNPQSFKSDRKNLSFLGLNNVINFVKSVSQYPEIYSKLYPDLVYKSEETGEFNTPISLQLIEAYGMQAHDYLLPTERSGEDAIQETRGGTSLFNGMLGLSGGQAKVDFTPFYFSSESKMIYEFKKDGSGRIIDSISQFFIRNRDLNKSLGENEKVAKYYAEQHQKSVEGYRRQKFAEVDLPVLSVLKEIEIIVKWSNFITLFTQDAGKAAATGVSKITGGFGAISGIAKSLTERAFDIVDNLVPFSLPGIKTFLVSLPIASVATFFIGLANPLNIIIPPWVRGPLTTASCVAAGMPIKWGVIFGIADALTMGAISITQPWFFSLVAANFSEKNFVKLAMRFPKSMFLWRLFNSPPLKWTGVEKARAELRSTCVDVTTFKNLGLNKLIDDTEIFTPAYLKKQYGFDLPSDNLGEVIPRLLFNRNKEDPQMIKYNFYAVFNNIANVYKLWLTGYGGKGSNKNAFDILKGEQIAGGAKAKSEK